jgi:DNA (cytosine-5)-methyltransferase 1
VRRPPLTSIEICAGAGGQAIGLEQAGFAHLAVVELAPHACATLRANRPYWNTVQDDVTQWHATRFRGKVDLFAGGVPCPPFSKAGKQLGAGDERDLFPTAMRLIRECQPRAVMLENVRGLLDRVFDDYRANLDSQLREEGYEPFWRLHQASDFGVPQLRPRTILVALKRDVAAHFEWPAPGRVHAPTVGEALVELMAAAGWEGAASWAAAANRIAPTLVGGSTKHGGPDLGPTRARREWAALGVNGKLLAKEPPPPGFEGMPCLTVEMTAALQGFPRDWRIMGTKTHAYRQVGNAFPPPVAKAVGLRIAAALRASRIATADAELVAA